MASVLGIAAPYTSNPIRYGYSLMKKWQGDADRSCRQKWKISSEFEGLAGATMRSGVH
jgi:hypothetical protein